MNKIKINQLEFYTIMVLFCLSCGLMLPIGNTAKQDVWISMILSVTISCFLFLLLSYFYRCYPDKTFTEIIVTIFGKYIGKLLVVLYSCYFIYTTSLVLRDIGEIISMYILSGTPMVVVIVLFVLVIMYSVYLGIETLARTGQISLFFQLMIILFLVIFMFFSQIVKFENLLPIFEEGIKPVILSSVSMSVKIPFGQLIIHFMILHLVNKRKGTIKTGIFALITVGIVILIMTTLNMAVLGVYLYTHTPFPGIESVRLIDIGTFIQRLDTFAVVIYMIGEYFKLSLYGYGALKSLSEVFQFKKPKNMIIPIYIVAILAAILVSPNYTQHVSLENNYTNLFIALPFEIFFPILLLIILFIKNLVKKRKKA